MPNLRLLFLGSPHVECDGEVIELSRRKALALLCYLAVNEYPSSREVLAAMFWPECDERRARAGLRQALVSLNETPVSGWLQTNRETISLRRDDCLWIDTVHFNRLLETEPAAPGLTEALHLYRDNFMAGFTLRDSAEFDNWQSVQTQIFQQKLIVALEQLVALQIAAHDTENAILSVQRWLMIDVLHEPAQRQFMRLCAATGQRAAALRQYETYVDVLKQELGLVPSTETVRLYETIRNNEPVSLEEPVSSPRSILPPLPRLVVGRDRTLDDLRKRLRAFTESTAPLECSTIVIQGWPGIGKSTILALLAHDADLHELFRDGVLFASLGEQPHLFSELLSWAHTLGISDVHKLDSLEALSRRLAAVLRDKQMLLLVDDVWEAAHVSPLNIGGHSCALVVTTRLNEVAQALAGKPENIYRLPILSEANAIDLLRLLAPQVVDQYPNQIRELVGNLEGLPLALQVVGRLLNAEMNMGWGVADLLRDLCDGAHLLDAEAPADRIDAHPETSPTIRMLLKRSTDRLDSETRKRFALLGVFAPKPATFDIEAIRAVWRVPDAKPSIRTLVARGLLEPVSAGRFQMHALLVMHAKSLFSG